MCILGDSKYCLILVQSGNSVVSGDILDRNRGLQARSVNLEQLAIWSALICCMLHALRDNFCRAIPADRDRVTRSVHGDAG
jgi:hypothetical protein